jgi:hypothetical protein
MADLMLDAVMEDAVREGAAMVGVPCRVLFLFSNRRVSIMDAAEDSMCSFVHEVVGDPGVPELPFAISMVGPLGVWTKTTQGNGGNESSPLAPGSRLFLIPPRES